ncbi:MAG TPA: hypothetical protein VHM64_11030 [Candidatus Binatia bacterium]|nr:hypothetical protein [Candidatus Binatia bacterium]
METSTYNRELRAVGQALEARGISTFELKTRPGQYVVSGKPDKPASLVDALRQLHNNNWRRCERTLTFTPEHVNTLEIKGKTRRRAPGRLPDFYNVSNILRTIGAYLDGKSARLVEIQKRPLSLTLLYKRSGGYPEVEDRTIVSFYETFIELHGKRARFNKL